MRLYIDQEGAALPLVLMILFILTLLGTTIFMYNMAETKQVVKTEERMKAHYVARSGAHAVAAYLVENPDSAKDLIDSPEFTGYEFGEGEFDVLVYADALDEVHVKSIGRVGDSVQSVIVTVADRDIDFPLYANNVNVAGAAGTITGDQEPGNVYYGDTTNLYEHAESVLDEGAELINEKLEFEPVVLPCDDDVLSVFYGICDTLEPINSYGGEVIEEHSLYNEIELKGQLRNLRINSPEGNDLLLKAAKINIRNHKLTVTLDDNTVAIVVNEFSAVGNPEIYLWGSGRLMLYVDDYNAGGTFNYDPDPNSDIIVNVFVTTGGHFDMSGTPNFTGTIYAPHADSVLAGNSSLYGWVIADNFQGNGNFELNYVPMKMAGTSMDFINYRIQKWFYDE